MVLVLAMAMAEALEPPPQLVLALAVEAALVLVQVTLAVAFDRNPGQQGKALACPHPPPGFLQQPNSAVSEIRLLYYR